MISLGFVTNPEFIERYCDETELYIFPIALEVNFEMYQELIQLVISRVITSYSIHYTKLYDLFLKKKPSQTAQKLIPFPFSPSNPGTLSPARDFPVAMSTAGAVYSPRVAVTV